MTVLTASCSASVCVCLLACCPLPYGQSSCQFMRGSSSRTLRMADTRGRSSTSGQASAEREQAAAALLWIVYSISLLRCWQFKWPFVPVSKNTALSLPSAFSVHGLSLTYPSISPPSPTHHPRLTLDPPSSTRSAAYILLLCSPRPIRLS